ncbi:5-formyltetrahydrofolate cyclo-ligase [Pseudoalteromonas sp. McH1-7]|uniref:5-formyltetrahydrofolate cyclo-ligase n=1 Tax=Pseudoalteromonas sp. McH1-7 TaxID=2745574 RepID=UPI00158FF0D1|nr:5-formyltetrahydrofolate cyclo-ligase [Pseudoalteromonas sp. McH1-7]NUZ09790.1 5-formyltetrahydrofolate cyclo-ligase [Pseudoalteromonas sp. McH1-7]
MSKSNNNINNSQLTRGELRKTIRKRRNSLSSIEQSVAATQLNINFFQHANLPNNARIGVYLQNDGELDTSLLIQSLWSKKHQVYLPIIHPFNHTNLLFQKYEKNSPMKTNRYAILEPKLDCSAVAPLASLDLLLMPLVAFDEHGNRLGMGGGYYDRTLALHYAEQRDKPTLMGLAHDCQRVLSLPTEAWDIPLPTILTPTRLYTWPEQ